MNRDNDRQTSIILAVFGILPLVWLGLLIAPSVKGGLPEILPSLMNVMSDPFHIVLCEDSVKTVLVLLLCYWNGHRDLLLYTQELPTPGGTRQRKMGQCQSRGQEIPAEPTVRKQADDAGSPYRTQRQETPPAHHWLPHLRHHPGPPGKALPKQLPGCEKV